MDYNDDYKNLMDDRFSKADIIVQDYKNMKASLDYCTMDDLARKHNISKDNLKELLNTFNINGGKKRTPENKKKDKPLNLIIKMDDLDFLDDI